MIAFLAAALLTSSSPAPSAPDAGSPAPRDGGALEHVTDAEVIESLDLLLDLPELEALELLENSAELDAESP